MCGIAHVGALIELSKYIPLKAIKEWMGVSAGSFMSMCLCIGYTLEELKELCVKFDFAHIKDHDSVPGCLLHFGIDTGERLTKLIEACLHVKGLSSDFTFIECKEKFGLSLRIVATDVNDAVPVTFSPTDTPNYKLSNAVKASMSYPYYYQPFICPVTNHYLIDGGVISNYPLSVLPEEEHSRTLGILIRWTINKVENLLELDIDKLIVRPLYISLNDRGTKEAKIYSAKCIEIILENVDVIDFHLDIDTKNRIINTGKKSVEKYFKETKKIKRRHSL